MPDAKPPYSLSAESAKAILDAARPAARPSLEMIEGVRRWLETLLERAIMRATAKPIVMRDADRLETAFRKFQDVIESLQDRDNPPPCIPVSDGTNDWDHWLVEYRFYPFKRGRRPGTDWKAVGALLALYEVSSGRRASAAQANGPTMRYLSASLGELSRHSPSSVRSNFDPPSVDALKQQLGRERRLDIAREVKKLKDWIGAARGQ